MEKRARACGGQRDCLRIVMSKFLTIDLYIPHTTSVYAPVAAQPKRNTRNRAVVMSLGLALSKPNCSRANDRGSTSRVTSVNGLNDPKTRPRLLIARLSTTL